ncbi:MAG: hypothetical protein HZB67_01715 [Candidatus Aenigmarchaeota archaeon]|nr:hypothetical protein [Candidatus Aenigmarchaeota archaeon]
MRNIYIHSFLLGVPIFNVLNINYGINYNTVGNLDINSAFETTSRILFGESVGQLTDFDAYLKEGLVGKQTKSHFSGKQLMVLSDQYPENVRFFDYSTELCKVSGLSKSLNINEIKDIDSLFGAVKERLYYTGNKVLGESNYVENSDNVFDGAFVYHSTLIRKGKFVYACYLMNEPEFCFGSASSGQSQYIMRCFYNNTLKRCFECCTSVGSSDLYFCYNLIGCNDCMFTFNLRNKRNMVGNVQLDREQYTGLKKKLLAEVAAGLKAKKRFGYSIIDILNGGAHDS